MNLFLASLLAQATQATTQGAEPGFTIKNLVPIALMFGVFYFFVIRAKKKQQRQAADKLEKLKPGQRIQTIGGIVGVITQVNEKEVTVKVDETNNVKIKFVRNAIHRTLDDEKTETK